MSDPYLTLEQARLLATGSSLNIDPPNLDPICTTDAEFERLVNKYYTFFNERLSREVSFLVGLRPTPQVEVLRRLIYNLRTVISHTDNPSAEDAAARWRKQFNSPQDAADALAAALGQGLEILSKIAVSAARNEREAAQWRQLLSVDVGTVFSAVEVDLGMSFTERNRRRMVRSVERRVEVRPMRGDRRRIVADYCAQEILSDRRPLPVPYDEILDALGLLGTARASGAVLVAHSVAEISPELVGAAFISRVEETWRAAGAP